MRFTSELVQKANAIFKTICHANADKEAKSNYRSEAYKSAIKFFTSMGKGVVKFLALETMEEDKETVIKIVNVRPFFHEEAKKVVDRITSKVGDLFMFIDKETGKLCSCHSFQLIY